MINMHCPDFPYWFACTTFGQLLDVIIMIKLVPPDVRFYGTKFNFDLIQLGVWGA